MAFNGNEVVAIEVKNDLKKKNVDKHLNILKKFTQNQNEWHQIKGISIFSPTFP